MKIDREFVTRVSGNAALFAMATMTSQQGRNLGMQDFLLSKPIPAHALFTLLEAGRRLPDAMLSPLYA